MQEKLKKHTTSVRRPSRPLVVVSGFAVLIIAIALVSSLAFRETKNRPLARVAVVRITKDGFQPSTISVKLGTRIVWTNSDDSLHQVESNPYPKGTVLPSLKSAILNNSQSYEYTANSTGTFGYHDQLKPTINGTLVVQKQ